MTDATNKIPSNKPTGSACGAAAPRVLFRIRSLEVTPGRLAKFVLGLIIFGTLTWFWQQVGLEEMLRRARALPAVGVIVTISVLPLLGFPVSWLHLIAGVRFGFGLGLAVVIFSGLCHHFLGWLLVKILPARFFARLEPWREKLAGAGHRDSTLLCGLLPGMPYSVQLYLLPAIGVPLGMLLGLGVVLHTLRAVVTILLGNYGEDLTPGRIAILTGYYLTLLIVSAFTLRRLKKSLSMKTKNIKQPEAPLIEARARQLWQINGSPPGRDTEFWLGAESELRKEMLQIEEQAADAPVAPTK